MPTDLDSYSTVWTAITLGVLFAMIPAVLFFLSRAAAANTHPEPDQMDEVRSLAVLLNDLSEHLLSDATRAFESAPGERHALDALIQLAESAEAYRVLITSGYRSPAASRRMFYKLMTDFEGAWSSIPALRAYQSGRERFDRIRMIMEELKFFYDAQSPAGSAIRARSKPTQKPQDRLAWSPEDDPSSKSRPH